MLLKNLRVASAVWVLACHASARVAVAEHAALIAQKMLDNYGFALYGREVFAKAGDLGFDAVGGSEV